jgi:hypothetical protein
MFKSTDKRRGKRAAADENAELLKELDKLQYALDCVHGQLDYATDETLIDGYIYEIRALQMKYQYFLNLCRRQGVSGMARAAL